MSMGGSIGRVDDGQSRVGKNNSAVLVSNTAPRRFEIGLTDSTAWIIEAVCAMGWVVAWVAV
jgi:hypothetical protein